MRSDTVSLLRPIATRHCTAGTAPLAAAIEAARQERPDPSLADRIIQAIADGWAGVDRAARVLAEVRRG